MKRWLIPISIILAVFILSVYRDTGFISADQSEIIILDLINEERKSRGLPPFQHHPILQELADEREYEMEQAKQVSHDRPPGKPTIFEYLESKGMDCNHVGEDVGGSTNPPVLMDQIRKSPLHLMPLISDAKYAAVAVGAGGTVILTC